MTRKPSLRSRQQANRQNPPLAADPPKAEPRMCSPSLTQPVATSTKATPDRKTSQKHRWEAFQGQSFALPVADSPDAKFPDESPADQACAQADCSDYPRLRVRLRDMGLPFAPEYSQPKTATMIRKSARTVREWTMKGLMSSHCSPGGRPYYTAQDLEDHFAACERPSRRSR